MVVAGFGHRVALILACGLGCATAFAVWGSLSPSEIELQRQLVDFNQLPLASQQAVRDTYSDYFKSLPPVRKQQLQKIMLAVSSEQPLQEKLQALDQWFLGLPIAEQRFWREKIAAGDATAVSGGIFEHQRQSSRIIIDFSQGVRRFFRQRAPSSPTPRSENTGSRDGLLPLSLNLDQYAGLLNSAFPDELMSAKQRDFIDSLSTPKEQTLGKTLLALNNMRESRFSSEAVAPFVSSLIQQTEDFDSQWQQQFHDFVRRVESRSFGRTAKAMVVVSILDQAVLELGASFKNELETSSDAMLQSFEDLQDDKKRVQLMISSPDAARDELKKIVLQNQYLDDSPRRQLMLMLIQYEDDLGSLSQTLFSSFSGFGGRGPGGGGQPNGGGQPGPGQDAPRRP